MKKYLVAIVLGAFLFCSPILAHAVDWTITPSIVSEAGHYIKWKVVLTSNGSALSATDLIGEMSSKMKGKVQGETLMLMKISPGTGGVIPNTTINIILSDDESDAVFTTTGVSKDAISWHDLSNDINAYIPVMGLLYLTLNDIGDSGDQVTLYFISWQEED